MFEGSIYKLNMACVEILMSTGPNQSKYFMIVAMSISHTDAEIPTTSVSGTGSPSSTTARPTSSQRGWSKLPWLRSLYKSNLLCYTGSCVYVYNMTAMF